MSRRRAPLSAIALLLACTPPSEERVPDSGDSFDSRLLSVELSPSDAMATVLLLELRTSDAVAVQTRFWQGDGAPRTLASDASPSHSQVLWGLKPEQEVFVEVELIQEGEWVRGNRLMERDPAGETRQVFSA